jgi:uncharacterized membrane protein YGL010W
MELILWTLVHVLGIPEHGTARYEIISMWTNDISTWTDNISLKENLDYYLSQHRTRGCKITHMIGIPLIVFSLLPVDQRLRNKLFWSGWLLQLIGHYAFEHNEPVLLEFRSPMTFVSALIFITHQWKRILTGKKIVTS